MKKEKKIRTIEDFLRRKKVLTRFKKNVLNHENCESKKEAEKRLTKFLSSPYPDRNSTLAKSFIWSKTLEGAAFWSNIADKTRKETT